MSMRSIAALGAAAFALGLSSSEQKTLHSPMPAWTLSSTRPPESLCIQIVASAPAADGEQDLSVTPGQSSSALR